MRRNRIDVMFRVGPSTQKIQIAYPSGSSFQTLDLTAGNYETLQSLCAEIMTQIQTVYPGLGCTETNGVVSLYSRGSNFDVAWPHPTLRDWLGFSENVTNTEGITGTCAGVFVASLPWSGATRGWRLHLRRFRGPRQRGGSLRVGTVGTWRVTARADMSDAEEWRQYRQVLGYLLRGLPATWWHNTATATAWSWSNRWGAVKVSLSESGSIDDSWKTSPHLTILESDLEFEVWSE